MTLTAETRAKLRAQWRALAMAAIAGDSDGLVRHAPDGISWTSPFDDRADAFLLFALGRLAYATIKAKTHERIARQRPALAMLGQLALDLLDAAEPPAPAPRAQLPFRADLDG